jgi:hypothetical protein
MLGLHQAISGRAVCFVEITGVCITAQIVIAIEPSSSFPGSRPLIEQGCLDSYI